MEVRRQNILYIFGWFVLGVRTDWRVQCCFCVHYMHYMHYKILILLVVHGPYRIAAYAAPDTEAEFLGGTTSTTRSA